MIFGCIGRPRQQQAGAIKAAPIASCEARYGGAVDPDPSTSPAPIWGWTRARVDMADWHQFGAYTDWVPILHVIAKWGPSDSV